MGHKYSCSWSVCPPELKQSLFSPHVPSLLPSSAHETDFVTHLYDLLPAWCGTFLKTRHTHDLHWCPMSGESEQMALECSAQCSVMYPIFYWLAHTHTQTHIFRKAKMEAYSYRTAPMGYLGVILGHSQSYLGGRNCSSQPSIPLKLMGPINKSWHLKCLQSSSYICFFSWRWDLHGLIRRQFQNQPPIGW
jgi:hypothetical protein